MMTRAAQSHQAGRVFKTPALAHNVNEDHLNVGEIDVNGDDFGPAPGVRIEDDDSRGFVGVLDRDDRLLRQRVVVLSIIVLEKEIEYFF